MYASVKLTGLSVRTSFSEEVMAETSVHGVEKRLKPLDTEFGDAASIFKSILSKIQVYPSFAFYLEALL